MSNSSKIEQFILAHRQAFDMAVPDPQGWADIQKNLDRLTQADHLEQYLLLHRPAFDHTEPPATAWQHIERALSNASSNTLEDFIHTNRSDFDTETPDLRVWAAIDQAIPKRATKIIWFPGSHHIVRIAAAVALLIAGVNIGIWYAGSQVEPGMAMSDLSPEYAELEQYYQRDISAKQDKLASFASYRDENVTEDLMQMDNVMNELREELANVPPGNREQVVRAMIENYKAKAAILERVLERLDQRQQPNQQQPATTNSSNHEVEKI